MNARKLIFVLAIMLVMVMNVAMARSSRNSRTVTTLVESSGELMVVTTEVPEESGEEVEELVSGDAKVSGEIAEVGNDEAKVSGDTVEPVSGDNIATEPSGDVEATEPAEVSGDVAVSGEAVEELISGDAEVSGEVIKETESGDADVSGEEIIKANDIDDDKWYAPYVNEIVANGIMGLDDEGNFNPTSRVTKLDVVEAFFDFSELETDEKQEMSELLGFVDAGEDVNEEAKREDIAKVLYNFSKAMGGGFEVEWSFFLGFDDVDEISEDAFEAVSWCVMNDLMIGKSEDTFNPQDYATRAELATIFYRIANAE